MFLENKSNGKNSENRSESVRLEFEGINEEDVRRAMGLSKVN